jgi:phosphatidylserine synthase
MRLRPVDALIGVTFFAALGAMLLAFRGEGELAAVLFLGAFLADALHGVAAPADSSHRLGVELANVVKLIAFGICPGLLVCLAYWPFGREIGMALGASVVVMSAVRMALQAVRPPGDTLVSAGLPRAFSALFVVTLPAASVFEHEAVRHVAIGVLPLVAALNVTRLPFLRPFAWPCSRGRAGLCALSATSAGVGFALGSGFDVVLFWSAFWLLAGPIAAWRPMAARARGA